MSNIKQIIKNLIGDKNYNLFTVFVYRLINNVHYKFFLNNGIISSSEIKTKNKNVFFGYYDKSANNNDKILFLETSNNLKDEANVGYVNKGKKIYVTKTKTWNRQMGARINWFSDNEILYNDFEDDKYVSKIYNISNKTVKTFSFPFYDTSSDKKYSFFLNFSTLNFYRPGYGYTNIKIDNKNYDFIGSNGIYRGNFENNEINQILSMDKIVKYNGVNYVKNAYINHISCSPYSETVMFFHLWKDENEKLRNRVFLIDYDGNILNVIDDFIRASHYTFKNPKELLLTVLNNDEIMEYRLYNIEKKTFKRLNFLSIDGHPTYINEKYFITDTYPDRNGMQHLLLCDENSVLREIAQIYHNPRMLDEYRNDLHPRYNCNILTFDTLSGKYRTQKILKINLLDENYLSKQQNKLKESNSQIVLKKLSKNVQKSNLRALYAKFFDVSYQAHLLTYKMLKSKNKFIQNVYFNKLQKKYSIWISPKCVIGEGFHMMHLNGITIGSGAIIGKNCTIYQQVTIGNEKDKFPVIGDNVTIYAGAKVLGGIKIGNNAVIGANAVVLKDVPENSVAVGVPARIIKKE